MFSNILVATDLTEKSVLAIRLAAKLTAQTQGAQLTVLHVVDFPASLRDWSMPSFRKDSKLYDDLVARQVQAAEATLRAQIDELHMSTAAAIMHPILALVRTGSPAQTIASCADEHGVDVIIVARGKGGVLGSTAEQVVRMVGRTVLVAPVAGMRQLLKRRQNVIPFPTAKRRRSAAASSDGRSRS
ncbi:MAG: universal stress protein [Polyangia bacterium]